MTDSGPNPADASSSHSRLADIAAAIQLLTRIPLRSRAGAPANYAAAAWVFPLVGATIGFLGGLVFLVANRVGIGIGSATLLAIGAQVLLTGGLHEDGLADAADGLGGGRDREQKLAIMRDSRIGTYGVIALILAFGLRFAAIDELANSLISSSDEYDQTVSHISAVIIALTAAGAVSRSAMVVPWYVLPAARSNGLAASGGAVPTGSAVASTLLGAALAFLLLPFETWATVMGAAAVICGLVLVIARRQVGGHTGDVLGATQQVSEIAVLLAIAAVTIAI
ncbi:MAG TPA: adenosylcobinamide-GDP ribazoletransferase [Ferrovibrio sp.]|uniref:adenosylcobinamide-GDP ribazoletransferase n=1 Tax=Ferrovibrio sp. TaxID=1917215 RepID=UPI002B4AB3A7|nr:adenosylcobinamide-GDP ribazoletransferase [Ferrovibrio sp.]HLT79228.1 adenosylcobinamide-GDP ribazoletransferase [Ferrovibrio sp.]